MYILLGRKKLIRSVITILLVVAIVIGGCTLYAQSRPVNPANAEGESDYIKWVDFNASYEAMNHALQLDIQTHGQERELHWIELLAYFSAKNGNSFNGYRNSQMDTVAKQIQEGKTMEELTKTLKYYSYYYEAYSAVLSGFVGEYEIQVKDDSAEGGMRWEKTYGLKAFSPIAKGFYYNEFDDFGTSRSYGYDRKHLGHDMMGGVGTPIIAVEGGTVEALGWDEFGGWRIGIRSFDTKRYYYYAHLRKDFPYNKSLQVGSVVKPGDVIGYLGQSGYSTSENVNNIEQPHLHFGMELIFDESQKDGANEIWIDVYNIVRLLYQNRSEVVKDPDTKEYKRVYDIREIPED